MSTALDPTPITPPEHPAASYVVPDFAGDRKVEDQYRATLDRRSKTYAETQITSITRSFNLKRDELRMELSAADLFIDERKTAAKHAIEAYRARYPKRMRKERPLKPSFFANLLSFGAAGKLYAAAMDATSIASEAVASRRRISEKDERLEIDLKRALAEAERNARESIGTPEWIARLAIEDPEFSSLKARVDAIAAERATYAERLKAGSVSDAERRDRWFAEHDVRPISLPVTGIMFYRIVAFGSLSYFIVRDLQKHLSAIPYDARIEPIINGVFDIYRVGDGFEVRQRLHPDKLPFTILNHFITCCDGQDMFGREAYRQQRAWMRNRPTVRTMPDDPSVENQVRRLLVEFAPTIPSPMAPQIS